MKKTLMTTLLAFMVTTGAAQTQEVTPPLVYDQENAGAGYVWPEMPTVDKLPEIRQLPDALEGVGSFADWERRRNEIAAQIQHYGIGRKPAVGKEQVQARMDADTLVVDVTVNGQTLTLRSTIRYPQQGLPPYALMIGTSGISLPKQLFESRPVATMVFHEAQVNDYSQWRPHHERGEHHELCAMVCPRALLLLGNPDSKWLADESMQVSARAAHEVWRRFGIADRMACDIVGGHGHCQLPESQMPIVEAFIDRFLLGK